MNSKSTQALILIALACLQVGCPTQVNESSLAIPQKSGGGPAYFSENVQLIWKGDSLRTLRSLTVSHTGPIRVLSGPDSQLMVWLQADVQTENKDGIVDQFKSQFRKVSTLTGNNPSLTVPEWNCSESWDRTGKLSAVRGICTRELIVVLPRSDSNFKLIFTRWNHTFEARDISLPRLDVTLPEKGDVTLKDINATVVLQGGGRSLNLHAQKIDSLQANLKEVRIAAFTEIRSGIFIDFSQRDRGIVYLDGQTLNTFPYTR